MCGFEIISWHEHNGAVCDFARYDKTTQGSTPGASHTISVDPTHQTTRWVTHAVYEAAREYVHGDDQRRYEANVCDSMLSRETSRRRAQST